MIPEGVRDHAHAIARMHTAKAEAELRAADAGAPGADSVIWGGSVIAELAFVKGLPGPAEASGDPAMSGSDGEAALKAAEKLGYRPDAVFFTLSRPSQSLDAHTRARRLRLQLEAVCATAIVATDREAAEDLAAAFACGTLEYGVERRVLGRRLLALDGLEASLTDASRKREVWAQMLPACKAGPSY